MAYKDPEKERENKRKWRAAHPERLREQGHRYRAANREKIRDRRRKYYAKNREQLLEKNHKYYAKHRLEWRKYALSHDYGLTLEKFDALVVSQNGRCAICGDRDELVVDHDHETGCLRGLLCQHCNTGLGRFRDNLNSLQKAIDYLRGSN